MPVPTKIILAAVSALAITSVSACSSEPSPHVTELMEERAAREAAESSQPELLIEIVSAEPDLATLNRAVEASGVADELQGQGPFTGFAPTNAAFDKIGQDRVAELLQPEAKQELASLIKFHLISGTLRNEDIGKAIDEGGGSATFLTQQGGQIKATRDGENIVLEDSAGSRATLERGFEAKNGMLHKIDTVLTPN